MENNRAEILIMYELLKTQSEIDGLATKLFNSDKHLEYIKEERGRIHYRVSKVIADHGAKHSWLSQLQNLFDRDLDPFED